MAANDISVLSSPSKYAIQPVTYNVAAGATTINAGEPVARALGAVTVTALATAKPVVGTDFMAGFAVSKSTQTASVAGTVQVMPLTPGTIYLANPLAAASWDTQAEYDALTGKRVLFDLTGGNYTVTATDGATNGLVVAALTVGSQGTVNPVTGAQKVAFSVRNGVDALS